ncbi:MAG: helix-turn-helix domain-containing protein [Janthinobacterium lividum]
MMRAEAGRDLSKRTQAGTPPKKGTDTLLTEDEFKGFLKILGHRIRAIRKARNLNMRDIMISTGYYDAQWRKYECGGSMTLMSLLKIALALNVSLSELLGELDQWPLRSVAEISESETSTDPVLNAKEK